MAVDEARVASLVRELIEAIGEDPNRPGLVGTPTRVATAWAEFFSGVDQDPAEPLAHTISVSHGPAPETAPSGVVILRDVLFRSVCEHHLLPFQGKAHIAYLPGDQVVGLGALPKVVEVLASRPQVQERLGEQIADTIATSLDARGVLVVLDAAHQCVTTRGGKQAVATTVTVAARGELSEPAGRAEVLALIAGTASAAYPGAIPGA